VLQIYCWGGMWKTYKIVQHLAKLRAWAQWYVFDAQTTMAQWPMHRLSAPPCMLNLCLVTCCVCTSETFFNLLHSEISSSCIVLSHGIAPLFYRTQAATCIFYCLHFALVDMDTVHFLFAWKLYIRFVFSLCSFLYYWRNQRRSFAVTF